MPKSEQPAPWTLAGMRPAAELRSQGFTFLSQHQLLSLADLSVAEALGWRSSWDRLPADGYLRDGGRYRYRRHGCFEVDPDHASLVTHRAHWQSTEYNALHGGIDRWFEPIEASVSSAKGWLGLLVSLGRLFSEVDMQVAPRGGGSRVERDGSTEDGRRWYVEAHQFRIDTASGVGRPTPEGAHRDGVDFVAVILIERRQVRGGETRVFEADGPLGMRFVMHECWSGLMLDDRRMIHETTPLQPDDQPGYRDTLVLTYRRGGFQSDATASAAR